MAVVQVKSFTSSYRNKDIPQTCWLGYEINLHPGHDPWCCNGPGPVSTHAQHRHRYFTRRVVLRSSP